MSQDLDRSPIANQPISVVLPTVNSASIIRNTMADWTNLLSDRKIDFEIILVDDCSDDDTTSILSELENPPDGILAVRHEKRLGIGACLRTGFAKAQYPLLCCCPLDGRYKPAEIDEFLETIDKVDLVVGYRRWQQAPAWMKATGMVFRGMVRIALGLPLEPTPCWLGWKGAARRWLIRWTFGVFVHDADCAFRLFRREILERLSIQSDGAFVHSEFIAKANFLGALIAQIPVSFEAPMTAGSAVGYSGWNKPAWTEIRRVFNNPVFTPMLPQPETEEEMTLEANE